MSFEIIFSSVLLLLLMLLLELIHFSDKQNFFFSLHHARSMLHAMWTWNTFCEAKWLINIGTRHCDWFSDYFFPSTACVLIYEHCPAILCSKVVLPQKHRYTTLIHKSQYNHHHHSQSRKCTIIMIILWTSGQLFADIL